MSGIAILVSIVCVHQDNLLLKVVCIFTLRFSYKCEISIAILVSIVHFVCPV